MLSPSAPVDQPPLLPAAAGATVYPASYREVALIVPIALIVAAAAGNRFGIEVWGLNLRAEILAALLIALWLVVRRGVRNFLPPGTGIIEVGLAGWVAANFLSSLLFAPRTDESLKLSMLVASMFFIYLVSLGLFRSHRAVVWAAYAWVAVGSIIVLLGMASALTYALTGHTIGVDLEANLQAGVFTITPKVHSILWEPNIFGSYSLTVALTAFGLALMPAPFSPRVQNLLRVAVALGFLGVLLSMTRTAWAAGLLLLPAAALLALRLRLGTRRQVLTHFVLPALVGSAIGLGLGFSLPTISADAGRPLTREQIDSLFDAARRRGDPLGTQGSALLDRLSGLTMPDEVTSFTGRWRIYNTALEGWRERPILGWGTGSFSSYDPLPDKWIPNLEVHILFDTGLVGFAFFLVAVIAAALLVVRALRRRGPPFEHRRSLLFGVSMGGFALLVAYQMTEGSWLGFTWVYFALLVSAARHAPEEVHA